MIYGYSRCSLNGDKQDINRQIRELKNAGAKEVFFEYEHGDSVVKPQLSLLLDTVKEGDTILTTEVSRLARSTKQLLMIIDIIKEKKVCLDILGSIKVDCRNGEIDPFTEAVLKISGVFAELELTMIRERVKSGIRNSIAKGVKVGRPRTEKENIPPAFYKHYSLYKAGKMNISELSRVCNISRNTVYKYIKIIEK